MKYSAVLYSRSHDKDYRWICVPNFASDADLERLLDVYRMFFNFKTSPVFGFAANPVVWNVKLASGVYIFRCGASGKKDSVGRPIFHLQGLAARISESSSHSWCVSAILQRQDEILDVWKLLDWEKIDLYNRFEVSLDVPHGNQAAALAPKAGAIRQQLAFNLDGFNSLPDIVASRRGEGFEFAFGISSKDVPLLGDDAVYACVDINPDSVPKQLAALPALGKNAAPSKRRKFLHLRLTVVGKDNMSFEAVFIGEGGNENSVGKELFPCAEGARLRPTPSALFSWLRLCDRLLRSGYVYVGTGATGLWWDWVFEHVEADS